MCDTDKDILELLYSRYYNDARLYCLALCGNRETAEDLVADAFVKAYLSLSDDVPSFRYWLFRVCKNLWIDLLRKEKRRIDSTYESWPADLNTPETEALKAEQRKILREAIESLEQSDREILLLHYFFDMPLYEIAKMQSKSYDATRQRLTRLRQTLKKRLEEQGYEL